jgi:hypothetical protein
VEIPLTVEEEIPWMLQHLDEIRPMTDFARIKLAIDEVEPELRAKARKNQHAAGSAELLTILSKVDEIHCRRDLDLALRTRIP